jgi:hypothetical protein
MISCFPLSAVVPSMSSMASARTGPVFLLGAMGASTGGGVDDAALRGGSPQLLLLLRAHL